MNTYPYIKTRKLRAYYYNHQEAFWVALVFLGLILILGLIGTAEIQSLKAFYT